MEMGDFMMRFVIFAWVMIMVGVAHAAAPSTTCPVGFVTIVESAMVVADSTCPTGYTSVGNASSCLVTTPEGACIMYAPAEITYSDTGGSYHYIPLCPLT